jgi:hypothetical protein
LDGGNLEDKSETNAAANAFREGKISGKPPSKE